MIPEPTVSTTSSTVPAEISRTIESIHSEMEKLRQELSQAQEVWKSTLESERGQFGELLNHKELAWAEQEHQWAQQSQGYEQQLEALKSDFETRLKQTEQNAAQALVQLDDDWQRDKLEWGPREQWPAERRQLEEKVRHLEEALAAKEKAPPQPEPPAVANPTPTTVNALKAQLLEFQETVATFQDRAARSDELVSACVQALDYQISVLFDLVEHFAALTPSGESPNPLV